MDQSFFDGKTAQDVVTHFELHPANAGPMEVMLGEAELALYAIYYDSHTDEEWVYEQPVKVKVFAVHNSTGVLRLCNIAGVCPIPGIQMVGHFSLRYEPTIYRGGYIACGTDDPIDWSFSARGKFNKDYGEWLKREESPLRTKQ